QEFSAEARTKGARQGIFAGLEGAFLKPLLKNEEDGGAGKVADIPEDVPGRLGIALAKAEFFLDVAEKARAAGMKDPTLDVALDSAATREEIVDQTLDFGANHLWHVLGEKNVEAGIAEIEAHGAQGIREGISFGGVDARAGLLLAGDHHGGGAIAEKDGGNQVGLRDVLALERERGQFHGNNENIAAGIGAKIIGGAG